jgi:hypothetical protein
MDIMGLMKNFEAAWEKLQSNLNTYKAKSDNLVAAEQQAREDIVVNLEQAYRICERMFKEQTKRFQKGERNLLNFDYTKAPYQDKSSFLREQDGPVIRKEDESH